MTQRRPYSITKLSVAIIGIALLAWVSASAQSASKPSATAQSARAAKPAASSAVVKRGEYLVKGHGCADCHTPNKMGPNGPEPDESRYLSGRPANLQLPPPPAPSGPWIVSVDASGTSWAGPWGISYPANLTPDPETGLGQWTEQQFIETIRNGRHQGRGREILPPMPWQAFRNMNDADLKAIFAYLRSIPPVKNKVPDPVIAAPSK